MHFFKIYGLPRSGTNFLQALIEENIQNGKVLPNVLGNKHEFARPEKYIEEFFEDEHFTGKWPFSDFSPEVVLEHFKLQKIYYVFCLKSPLAWLLSYYKLRKLKNPSAFSEFRVKAAREFLNFWFLRVAQWGQFVASRGPGYAVVVDYERLLIEGEFIMAKVSRRFGVSLVNEKIVSDMPFEMKRGIEGTHSGSSLMIEGRQFNKNYYLNKEYLSELPVDVLEFAKEFVADAVSSSPFCRIMCEVSGGSWTID